MVDETLLSHMGCEQFLQLEYILINDQSVAYISRQGRVDGPKASTS